MGGTDGARWDQLIRVRRLRGKQLPPVLRQNGVFRSRHRGYSISKAWGKWGSVRHWSNRRE